MDFIMANMHGWFPKVIAYLLDRFELELDPEKKVPTIKKYSKKDKAPSSTTVQEPLPKDQKRNASEELHYNDLRFRKINQFQALPASFYKQTLVSLIIFTIKSFRFF